jgi:hypothetical protein
MSISNPGHLRATHAAVRALRQLEPGATHLSRDITDAGNVHCGLPSQPTPPRFAQHGPYCCIPEVGYSNMVHVAVSTVHSGRGCRRPNRVNQTNRTGGSQHRAPAWRRVGDTASDSAPPGWTQPRHWRVVSGARTSHFGPSQAPLTAAAAGQQPIYTYVARLNKLLS